MIDVKQTSGGMELTITDDGIGIQEDPDLAGGLGIRIMRYRAHLIQAQVDVSRGPKGGTVVRCTVPRTVS
jgi:two-component system nitrate/nitrite sensor histidine kinase NarQ